MKLFVILAAVCAALAVSVSTAGATSSGWRWTSADKFAFIDHWNNWAIGEGYRYPTLYAYCLQKATASMYPSYTAFMRDTNHVNRWVNQTEYCMTDYGQTWYDN